MIEFGKVRITIERHGDKLTTFEHWKAERGTDLLEPEMDSYSTRTMPR